MFYDYQNNVPHYPAWQAYFHKHQPPTLIVWGKNDYIFPAEGAHSYTRDLKNPELHLLDTGHFSLEEDGQMSADYIREFLTTRVASREIKVISVETQLRLISAGRVRGGGTLGAKDGAVEPTGL